MRLTTSLRANAHHIWIQILNHPFVQGIGDGSLPIQRFKFYLKQDYLFLIDYSKVLALAAAKAPELSSMTYFGELLHSTLSNEMDLHRRYCKGFGISTTELETTKPTPQTLAYSKFLISTAYEGSIGDISSALLPCQWGYFEIAQHLTRIENTGDSNRYADWIRTYSSADFQKLATWLREYLDTLAQDLTQGELNRLQELFDLSSYYEYDFWNASWQEETWVT